MQNPNDPGATRIDTNTAEGRAIDDLYHLIRGRIEDGDGWNGGDVVDAVTALFVSFGYDVAGPYTPPPGQ